jgi:hypothetical protein
MSSVPEVALKSAGPQAASDLRGKVTSPGGSFFLAQWMDREFMLADPCPVDELEDVESARAALAESEGRVSYEQFRRELGL